jgi:hypothetical protein
MFQIYFKRRYTDGHHKIENPAPRCLDSFYFLVREVVKDPTLGTEVISMQT